MIKSVIAINNIKLDFHSFYKNEKSQQEYFFEISKLIIQNFKPHCKDGSYFNLVVAFIFLKEKFEKSFSEFKLFEKDIKLVLKLFFIIEINLVILFTKYLDTHKDGKGFENLKEIKENQQFALLKKLISSPSSINTDLKELFVSIQQNTENETLFLKEFIQMFSIFDFHESLKTLDENSRLYLLQFVEYYIENFDRSNYYEPKSESFVTENTLPILEKLEKIIDFKTNQKGKHNVFSPLNENLESENNENIDFNQLFVIDDFELKKNGYIFNIVNNREIDVQKSGLESIKKTLCDDYDNVYFSVSASLKHKNVFEVIEQLSKIEEEKNIEEDNSEEKEIERKPFIEVSQIKSFLKEIEEGKSKFEKRTLLNPNKEEIEEEKQVAKESQETLEQILLDLHSLGVIIYFKDPSLKDIVIPHPKWFNKVKLSKKNSREKIQTIY